MTVYKPGDVVIIPFPFTDWAGIKQRPAFIISSEKFNQTHRDVILCAITSQIPSKLEGEEYRLSQFEQKLSGLPKPSIIKLGKIVTLDQRLIRKKLGGVPQENLEKIYNQLYKILKSSE